MLAHALAPALIHRDRLDQSLGRDPHAYAARTGRAVLERKFEAYAASLPCDARGRISAAVTVDRACPLCASVHSTERFVKYGFPIHACNDCGFEFARPVLDQRQVSSGVLGDPDLSQDHLAFISQPVYRACASLRFEYELQQLLAGWSAARAPRSFLEVGSSTGIGLEVASRYGLDVTGIEPNADAACVARAAGHEVMECCFEPGCLGDRRFDLIMTLDVLEHVPEPIAFLGGLRDALEPGGLLLVQVPNTGSLIVWLEGPTNQIYNGLIHLNYFDPASLDRMAIRAGLVPVQTSTFLSEVGKLRGQDACAIEAAVRIRAPHLLEGLRLHQDWINDNGLGYKVLGIYQRPPAGD